MTELGEAKRKHQASGKAKSRTKSKDSAEINDKEVNQDSDEAEIIEHSGTISKQISFHEFIDCAESNEWTLKYSQMEAILFQEDNIREFFERQTDIRIEAEKTLRAIIHQK